MRRRATTPATPVAPFPFEPFRTIVADCPWPYGDKLPGKSRGASKNYDVMSVDEIARYLGSSAMHADVAKTLGHLIPTNFIAPDARLFLWRVHPMQAEALHVMKAWGFGEPISELVWNKTTVDDEELAQRLMKFHRRSEEQFEGLADPVAAEELRKVLHSIRAITFGMGRTFRLGHEVCLVGRRGRPELLSKSESSVLFAPVREHSQKPEEFFERVERVSPGPYLELFSGGHRRAGWTSLGYAHLQEKNDGKSVGHESEGDHAEG